MTGNNNNCANSCNSRMKRLAHVVSRSVGSKKRELEERRRPRESVND